MLDNTLIFAALLAGASALGLGIPAVATGLLLTGALLGGLAVFVLGR